MKNAFAKLLCGFLIVTFCVAAAAAQNDCDLAGKSAPLLLNLQIGMSPVQTRAILGKALKIKIKKRGERTFFQNFIKKPAPASLRGVRAVYLRFFDLKLYQIEVFYEPHADLQTLADVQNRLSSALNLNAADWRATNNRSTIHCGEISLAADYILNPRVEITDQNVLATVKNARKKAEKR